MLLLSYRGAGTHRTVDEIPISVMSSMDRTTQRRHPGRLSAHFRRRCRTKQAGESRDIDMGIVGAMNPVEPCEESAPDANVTRKPGLLMLPEGEPNTMKPDSPGLRDDDLQAPSERIRRSGLLSVQKVPSRMVW
jgi:hypothetical protein